MTASKDDGKQIQLVKSLALTSASDQRARKLVHFFNILDNDGWLVEVSRVHLRLQTMGVMTHQLWAELLGIEDGSHYRVILAHPDAIRRALVETARQGLKLVGRDALNALARSNEFMRWAKVQRLQVIDQRRRGSKVRAVYTRGDDADQLERTRAKLGMTLHRFAGKLGVADNTYRSRLGSGDIPPDWFNYARVIEEEMVTRRRTEVESFNSVTDEELDKAFDRAWHSCEERSDALRAGEHVVPDDKSSSDKVIELSTDVESFEPSEEVSLEDIE